MLVQPGLQSAEAGFWTHAPCEGKKSSGHSETHQLLMRYLFVGQDVHWVVSASQEKQDSWHCWHSPSFAMNPPAQLSTHRLLSSRRGELQEVHLLTVPEHVLQLELQTRQVLPSSILSPSGQTVTQVPSYSFCPAEQDLHLVGTVAQVTQGEAQGVQTPMSGMYSVDGH